LANSRLDPAASAGLSEYLSTHKYQTLLTASLILLVLFPYMNNTAWGEILLDLVTSVVLLAAILSITNHPRIFWIGLILMVPAIAGAWWPIEAHHPVPLLMGLIFSSAFFTFVTAQIFRDVFNRQTITKDTLFGAICIYVLLGLAWSFIYLFQETVAPGSFDLGSMSERSYPELSAAFLYYSYTTLTTTGYGDILPLTQEARSLAILEQGVGVLYIAIMVARLVSMYRVDE
jgi:hypothetical protein